MEELDKNETKSVLDKLIYLTKLDRELVEIEGFMPNIEAILLYALVKYGTIDLPVVEIGSFKGKSTCWIAHAVRDRGFGKVYAVDHHKGSPELWCNDDFLKKKNINYDGNTLPEFLANIEKHGVKSFVEPIVKSSMDAVEDWKFPIGFLFIDGSHEYEDVKNDFEQWSKFVVKNGLIVFHDSEWAGVKQLLDEQVRGNDKYKIFCFYSMTVLEKLED